MIYLFGLLCSAIAGGLVGFLYQSVQQDTEIKLLRGAISFWRSRAEKFDSELDLLCLYDRTFDPDLYNDEFSLGFPKLKI
jgi:hypothetical protein